MADAIDTGNPVTTPFVINKYEDIDQGRINQTTARGRLAFKDTNGRYTLPRTNAEAAKAVFVVDWPKPLNPPPYFEGAGLNGAPPYPFSDGSYNAQTDTWTLDTDVAYQTPWPVGYVTYEVPPLFYNVAMTSGNKCLVFDGGTFTYASGSYVGGLANYAFGGKIYPSFESGHEGKVSYIPSGVAVGFVFDMETFGAGTLTVKMKGNDAL